MPGAHIPSNGHRRAQQVIDRILALSEASVASTLASTLAGFAQRHPDLDGSLLRNYEGVAGLVPDRDQLTVERRLLIGAYFTHEYSVEAAALSNPSIVTAPDQSGLGAGEQRFILSLRAIGEGHLSSIEFRSGVIGADGGVSIEEPSRFTTIGERREPTYQHQAFRVKLRELGVLNEIAGLVLDPLPADFTLAQLESAIGDLDERGVDRTVAYETTRIIHWVAASNYTIEFPAESHVSERVIFPSGPSESQGMEDARFVRFRHEDGTVVYYAVYTAFDGFQILPAAHRNGGLPHLPHRHAQWRCRAQQGHGPLPEDDRRALCGTLATGQREQLPDVLGRCPHLAGPHPGSSSPNSPGS